MPHKLPEFPDLAKALPIPIEPLFDAVPPEKRRLGVFIVLATLAHVLAFFFIQITYPQPELHSSSRVHATLANAGSGPTARSNLQFWYTLQDPSLLIRLQEPLVSAGQADIVPITQNQTSSGPTPVAVRSEDIAFLPDGLPSLTERAAAMSEAPRQVFDYQAPAPTTKNQTILAFDPALAARLPETVPTLPSQPATLLTEAGVTVLRLGVSESGAVEHVFVDQSCGKTTVDTLAVQALRRTRFESISKPGIVWGQVTIYWQFEADPGKDTPH